MTRRLIACSALAFKGTSGLGTVRVLFPNQITAIFGEYSMSNPLFNIGVYSPTIAGVVLV